MGQLIVSKVLAISVNALVRTSVLENCIPAFVNLGNAESLRARLQLT